MYNKEKTTLIICLKSKTGSVNIPSSVTSIGDNAFSECTGLTSVNIPSSVTSIGSYAFNGCTGLTSVNISEGVTSIGSYAFNGCTGLTSVNIPEGVTSIGSYEFNGCTGLTSVNIPSSVTSIGYDVFNECTGLTAINVSSDNLAYSFIDGILYNKEKTTLIICPKGKTGSVNIPSSVTSIGDYAFYECTGLTAINIPSSVTSIGYDAFNGCTGLTSVNIPSSVTSIGYKAFSGCTLKSLYLFCKLSYYSCLNGLNSSSIIYAHSSEIKAISKNWLGHIADIETSYSISIHQAYLKGVEFNVIANEYVPGILQSVKLGDSEVAPNENGMYVVTNLTVNTSYDIVVTFKTADGETIAITKTVKTLEPTVEIGNERYTQTTMTISINASSDQTCPADKKGFIFNNKEYDCTNDKVVLTGLIPNTTYTIYPFAEYGTMRISKNKGIYVRTSSLNINIVQLNVGPTSISVKGRYTVKDAHVSETGFRGQTAGDTLTLTGLNPNTSYTVSYYVQTEEGSNETVNKTFTTPALELTTLQPHCVSSTCAIVAAETNICEDEMNVGFQWKKYDAPESLKPSEGYAAIYDGKLEGYVKNLQSTSYYNVRAFYKSAEGNYYYGNWVTFDPSDFSYFEPTVHTYEAVEIGSSSAKVKGYVLAGTDDIIEQGFEYWLTGKSESKAMRVKAIAENNVTTVLGTGQVMTATLTDLQPSSTYCFRSFVKTASGTTYGEEQRFTTDASTDIGCVETDASSLVIIGYYDLNGRKYNEPQKGVNIIRYSDGSARKILIK